MLSFGTKNVESEPLETCEKLPGHVRGVFFDSRSQEQARTEMRATSQSHHVRSVRTGSRKSIVAPHCARRADRKTPRTVSGQFSVWIERIESDLIQILSQGVVPVSLATFEMERIQGRQGLTALRLA